MCDLKHPLHVAGTPLSPPDCLTCQPLEVLTVMSCSHWPIPWVGDRFPAIVTIRIITFLLGDPYKPSFATLGRGTTQPIHSSLGIPLLRLIANIAGHAAIATFELHANRGQWDVTTLSFPEVSRSIPIILSSFPNLTQSSGELGSHPIESLKLSKFRSLSISEWLPDKRWCIYIFRSLGLTNPARFCFNDHSKQDSWMITIPMYPAQAVAQVWSHG